MFVKWLIPRGQFDTSSRCLIKIQEVKIHQGIVQGFYWIRQRAPIEQKFYLLAGYSLIQNASLIKNGFGFKWLQESLTSEKNFWCFTFIFFTIRLPNLSPLLNITCVLYKFILLLHFIFSINTFNFWFIPGNDLLI